MTYKVYVNGVEHKVYDARVSAVPMNRVWSGTQRPLDQTEMAHFVSFDMKEPVNVCVEVCGCTVKKAELRPRAYGICTETDGNSITFTLAAPANVTLLINGYHEALHIFANEPYIYVPRGDDIYFGQGEHHAGLITPTNGQRVIIDSGAVVYGVLYIKDVENVIVEGRGILDASPYCRGNDTTCDDAAYEVNRTLSSIGLSERDVHYTGLLNVYASKNVIIDGIILRDSQLWTIIIRNGCSDVLTNNIKIIGQWRYNSDGIDICASDNVTIQNSFIRSFDDCVVVRAPYLDEESGGCSDVIVKNNVLWCDWGKNLEIWSGDRDSYIHDILFENNYIIHAQMTAISIDTWFGSEKILVENVRYDGVFVEDEGEHLHCMLQTYDDEKYDYEKAGDRTDQVLVCIGVGKLGKNLGNQQFDTSIDTSTFDIRYRNINLKNIIYSGDFPGTVVTDKSKLAEPSNVVIEDICHKEYTA